LTGQWVKIGARGYVPSANTTVNALTIKLTDGRTWTIAAENSWQNCEFTDRAVSANPTLNILPRSWDGSAYGLTVGDIAYFDAVSVKALTLSDLISGADYGYSDVIVNADLAVTTLTQAGVIACLDSLATPANFLLAHHDRTNATLLKRVAGVYTSLISAAATYVANAPIRIIKDGTTVTLFYNNSVVGTPQTVNDAGIINNKIHGTFSTYASNTCDNFEVWPRHIVGYARQELEKYAR